MILLYRKLICIYEVSPFIKRNKSNSKLKFLNYLNRIILSYLESFKLTRNIHCIHLVYMLNT